MRHCAPPWSPCHRRVLPKASTSSSSPPRSVRAVIESSSEPPRLHLPQPESVTPSMMQVPSPSPWCCSRACNNVVLPEPTMSSTRAVPRPAVSSSSMSPWCHRHRDAPEPMTPSNSRSLEPATLHCIIFLCNFGPTTNPNFDMLPFRWKPWDLYPLLHMNFSSTMLTPL
jgi:hypothetical protein